MKMINLSELDHCIGRISEIKGSHWLLQFTKISEIKGSHWLLQFTKISEIKGSHWLLQFTKISEIKGSLPRFQRLRLPLVVTIYQDFRD